MIFHKLTTISIIAVFLCLLLIVPSENLAQCNDCSACQQKSRKAKIASIPKQNKRNVKKISEKDEFLDFKKNNNKNNNANDEFEDFEDFDTNSEGSNALETQDNSCKNNNFWDWNKLSIQIVALFFTIIAGIFFRNSPTRKFRYLFLIGSAIYLGFYNGACPCPISSLSHFLIGITGGKVHWANTMWIIGLVPVTYFFGKVWCGWVCHLGALQEFLYKPGKYPFLQGEKAQKTMRIIRWVLLGVLIVQLLYSHTYLFNKIDPFRIAFNLGQGANLTSWILLGLLLLSSVFINRPFCKAACPIGLVLGWVSHIPGASVLGPKAGQCTGCRLGSSACEMDAIVRQNNINTLKNSDCIACGECIDACAKDALTHYRKSKKHPSTVVCGKSTINN